MKILDNQYETTHMYDETTRNYDETILDNQDETTR